MNNGYTESITARVTPKMKNYIIKHNISPRFVFQKGIEAILPSEITRELKMESLQDRIRTAKAEVVVLENELEEMEKDVNCQCLHSCGDSK